MSDRDEHYARFYTDASRSLTREVFEFEKQAHSPILGPDGRNIPLPPRPRIGFNVPGRGE